MSDQSADHEWVYVKEAWRRLPRGTKISLSGFRRWAAEQRYGIVTGVFGSRTVIRADTIPRVRVDE